MYQVVEKLNPLVVHAICDNFEGAQRWIAINAPEYIAKGYFMNKSLTVDSFTIKAN